MATLGSSFHDFPLLAKQSGFYFQLHTGRVNWSEIENLNINEIIEKRNFRLLEQNLSNVINCNLEREYDIKILDQNFVKLFKLAQLGINYLSYCEMYLDRCVVLLQEQLTAFQEDYESLKQYSRRKKEETEKNGRKNKKDYQCDKCEKIFISDVYLKFHDKRRHGNPNTPNRLDVSQKKLTDNSQQTEDGRKSTFTQTLYLNEMAAVPQEYEDRSSIKMEYTIKIEKLEQELKNLKERLRNAESSLAEKTELSQSSQTNVFHPFNVPGSMCYNSMLMLLPSYVKHPESVHYESNPERQIPEVYQHIKTALFPHTNSKGTETDAQSENKSQLETKSEKTFSKENEFSEQKNKSRDAIDSIDSFQEHLSEGKNSLDHDKENLDPNLKKNVLISVTRPLPPPRKLKKGIMRKQPIPADKMMIETFTIAKEDTHQEDTKGFSGRSITHRSTPIKEKHHTENNWEDIEGSKGNLSEIGNKPGSNSTESLTSKKFVDHETKFEIKKIVASNSPKLRNFSKNLITSLTNLYDSVSPNGKDSKKPGEQNIRATLNSGVNSSLRELGVDPEWYGIPKQTMRQKLSVLKQRRKLLSKANPVFPVLRRSIEAKIFQKIKNNLGRKKATLIRELNEQESMKGEVSDIENVCVKNKSHFVEVSTGITWDTDSGSESTASYLERNFSQPLDQGTTQKGVIFKQLNSSVEEDKVEAKKSKEFDFSVFQVGVGSLNSFTSSVTEEPRGKRAADIKNEGPSTDSDTETRSPEQSEEKIFSTFKGYLSSKNRNESNKAEKNLEPQLQFAIPGKSKSENHSILKNSEGLHSRDARKRVLFASCSDGTEELSDSPMDLWPFKSDSLKDVS